MKRSLLLCLLAAAATACATSSRSGTPASSTEEEDNDMVCRYESPTGSHLRKRVCRPRAAMEEEQREAEEFMRRGAMKGTVRSGS